MKKTKLSALLIAGVFSLAAATTLSSCHFGGTDEKKAKTGEINAEKLASLAGWTMDTSQAGGVIGSALNDHQVAFKFEEQAVVVSADGNSVICSYELEQGDNQSTVTLTDVPQINEDVKIESATIVYNQNQYPTSVILEGTVTIGGVVKDLKNDLGDLAGYFSFNK